MTRNFRTSLVEGAKGNGGAGEITGKSNHSNFLNFCYIGRNMDATLNSKDSGRYTGFKSYDTTKMPMNDKEEL